MRLNRLAWCGGSGLLIAVLCLQLAHEGSAERRVDKRAATTPTQLLQVEAVSNQFSTQRLREGASQEDAPLPKAVNRRPFRSAEDLHYAELEVVERSAYCHDCLDAGLLSQALLAELCGDDLPLQVVMEGPMSNRLLVMFALHPKAAAHIEEIEDELRGHVDCANQQTWAHNVHLAVVQRGVLDEPLGGEMEAMLNTR